MCTGKRRGGGQRRSAYMEIMEGIQGWVMTRSGLTMGGTKGEGLEGWRDGLRVF